MKLRYPAQLHDSHPLPPIGSNEGLKISILPVMNPLTKLYPSGRATDVFSIDYAALRKAGFRAIIFDIDNTLVAHGADSTPQVDELFRRLHDMGFKTLLLSNNSEERIRRFAVNIDTLFIADARKPEKKAFCKALEMLGSSADDTLMIGDTTFTDIAGANGVGVPSILVRYIGYEKWEWKGFRRYLEKILLLPYPIVAGGKHRKQLRIPRKKKLFCERGPLAYNISVQRQILTRKLRDLRSGLRFASHREIEMLPVTVHSARSGLIKRGPGIDHRLQVNKAHNIALACSRINGLLIRPGEIFSFWRLVGKTSARNGFQKGRVLVNGKLVAGRGGGLCNLANSLHLVFMHSPLTMVELHHHSDALAPDPEGIRRPYSAGTSVNYNYLDLRFRNDTDRPVQIMARCTDETLEVALLTTEPFATSYRIVEEGHHFKREDDGYYYRKSRIYRETIDCTSGRVVGRELKWDNRSRVMFDPRLIPIDQIR